jgi:hypothetical protein
MMRDGTIVKLVSICAITVLEVTALLCGLDGTLFAASVGAIVGISSSKALDEWRRRKYIEDL